MEFKRTPADQLALKRRGKVCGIGINDADYKVVYRENGVRLICPFYRAWQNMLERCYGPKTQKNCPTYKGCSVAKEWHHFMNFRAWMEVQDWEGKELDKDILIPGNRIYSPSSCVFVSKRVNQILCDSAGSRGDLPIGVTRCRKRFLASIGGLLKGRGHLGVFDTPEEASAAYRKKKASVLREVALRETNPIRAALLRRSAELSC